MKRIKKEYMSAETSSALMESARQALAYERGTRDGYRVTRLAVPKTSLPVPSKQSTSSARGYRAMRYKGYKGAVTLDEDANIFYGEVINTRDVITFQGASLEECKQSFRGSVNEYLEFCRERGEEPDEPL
jgi:predicted RNase H-like HicB family nuclease